MTKIKSKKVLSKIDKCVCKCPGQDLIHGEGRRVWNPRIMPKGLVFKGWTCTGCGTKTTEFS